MASVRLVARSYEWTCPECGETHLVSKPGAKVSCPKCGASFCVAGLDHAGQEITVTIDELINARSAATNPPDVGPPDDDGWLPPMEDLGRPVPDWKAPWAGESGSAVPAPATPPKPPPVAGVQQSLF